WVHHKFGLAIDFENWKGLDKAEIAKRLKRRAREHYGVKESELPVRIAVTRFLGERSQSQTPRYDRDGLAAWASERFHSIVDADELRPLLRPEIESHLLDLAHKHYQGTKL